MFRSARHDRVMFDLLEGLAVHGVSAAGDLHGLALAFPNLQDGLLTIRRAEREADEVTHQILERLDRVPAMRLDRPDLHALVVELDNIVDNINALGRRLAMYHVKAIDPLFIKQTTVLHQAAGRLRDAIYMLRPGRAPGEIHEKLLEVHRLENVGNEQHLQAMSRLFDGTVEPLEVMKWKEFFGYLEAAIDGCEDAGNVLERLSLKRAGRGGR
jgi:uncharacterized protein Yka (UPF0111/DUF47 family)